MKNEGSLPVSSVLISCWGVKSELKNVKTALLDQNKPAPEPGLVHGHGHWLILTATCWFGKYKRVSNGEEGNKGDLAFVTISLWRQVV